MSGAVHAALRANGSMSNVMSAGPDENINKKVVHSAPQENEEPHLKMCADHERIRSGVMQKKTITTKVCYEPQLTNWA
jgi:hypothetical protein